MKKKDDVWGVFDYHLAAVIDVPTVRILLWPRGYPKPKDTMETAHRYG